MKSSKLYCYYFIFLFFFCFTVQSQVNNLLSCKLSKIGPTYDNNWNRNGYDTITDFIYLYKDIKLISRPIVVDFYDNGKLTGSELHSRYFVHHKDSLYGLLFDTTMKIIKQRVHIDSGSVERSLFNNDIEKDFKTLKIQTQQLNVVIDQFSFKDIYFINDKEDTSKNTILTLTFSNLMKTHPISISTYMDSLRFSKLVEIRTDQPERFFKKEKYTMAPYFFIYRMEPYESNEKDMIMNFINIYVKEIGLNIDN